MAQRLGTGCITTTDGHGKAVKAHPEWSTYILGLALCVALTMCSRHFSDRGGPPFMAWLTLACIAYLLAIWQLFSTRGFPRRVVVIGLALAAVSQLAFLRLPAGPNDDIHRYVWDGRLQRLGYNPYVVVPGDPAVKKLHTPETRTLNNPDLTSPYPPGAQLFFRAVTAIRESVFALKIAFAVCAFGIAIVLLGLLRSNGRGSHLILAYAWNPLLAIEVAGSGHIDIVGALLLVISLAALARRWRAIAAVTFGLAVAVKFLPLVLLPLYWKRIRLREAAISAGVLGLLYVPFLNHGRIPTGSLGTYVRTFRFNGPVFAVLDGLASPQLLAGLAVLVGFATSILLRRHRDQSSPEIFAWPMAASLLCAPVVFPWYLLWLLPLLTSVSTLLIIFWTVTIMTTYVMWHLSVVRGAWGTLPAWVMIVEYGGVALAAAVIALRRIPRTLALPPSAEK